MASSKDMLYDILFEVSSEERHSILKILKENSSNLTNISRETGLNLPETRRHVSRLLEVELIDRNPDGSYSITGFGERILERIKEISFFSRNKDYFNSHNANTLPHEFKIRLGDLSASEYHGKILEFLQKIEQIIDNANEYLCILTDEIPYMLLPSLEKAIKRGTSIRLITLKLEAENTEIDTVIYSALTKHSVLEKVDLFLVSSKQMAALTLPNMEGNIDYRGFSSKDIWTLNWVKSLFDYKWDVATTSIKQESKERENQIVIVGKNNPKMDVQAIQDAVDHFDEVVLDGVFDLGDSRININKSCKIVGLGRENDIPETKVSKSGWQIPFTSRDYLFLIRGEGINVEIENIHFTDFNGICVAAYEGGLFRFVHNRITLQTGFARGRRHPYSDLVIGLMIGSFNGPEEGWRTFPKGIIITGNYLDFALSHLRGGYISPNNLWDDPDYRPNLHEEYYAGIGVFVVLAEGEVVIKENTIRNMNSVGINLQDSYDTAFFTVKKNNIVSEIYGSHVHGWDDAGFGISVHSVFAFKESTGYHVYISENNITCLKRNYSGINICGPFNTPNYVKLLEGTVSNNIIHLHDGAVGIKVGRNDDIVISDNSIKGNLYYGIKVHGKSKANDRFIYAKNNKLINNDFTEFSLKKMDDYVKNNSDGVVFEENGKTGHIWLDKFTSNNVVKYHAGEIVVDKGTDNKIIKFEENMIP